MKGGIKPRAFHGETQDIHSPCGRKQKDMIAFIFFREFPRGSVVNNFPHSEISGPDLS